MDFTSCDLNMAKQICNLKYLIPPEVEPEQPPMAKITIKTMVARLFHAVKSSRAKPEVERIETTLNKATRMAFSIG